MRYIGRSGQDDRRKEVMRGGMREGGSRTYEGEARGDGRNRWIGDHHHESAGGSLIGRLVRLKLMIENLSRGQLVPSVSRNSFSKGNGLCVIPSKPYSQL